MAVNPLNVTKKFTRGKMPRPFLSIFSPSLGDPQNAMVLLSTHLLIYFLARAFLVMPTSTERLLARQKQKNSETTPRISRTLLTRVGLRNVLDHFSSFCRLVNARRHIPLGDDPDNPIVIVDDWNASQLMLRHRIQRLLHIVFATAGHNLARHHLFCFRGFGIAPFGHYLQSQIAIGT